MKKIAIVNQKGGVGKTTTSINLGFSLAMAGKKVLIIDLDPQGNATTGTGLSKETEKNIYNVLTNHIDVLDAITKTEYNGLEIISSNIDLNGAKIELINLENPEFILKNKIAKLENKYDYLIIDCPPSLGILTLNALTSADYLIIPVQCEFYALEGLGDLIRIYEMIKNNLNNNLKIMGILLTMYDIRTNLSDEVKQEVEKFFKEKVFKAIIPRNVRLSEAPSYGQPGIVYDLNCKGAKAYLEFAREVLLYEKENIGQGA